MIWLRERRLDGGKIFLLCSSEIDSGKGRRINEKDERASGRSPTWQLTLEIEDDRIAKSVKMAH